MGNTSGKKIEGVEPGNLRLDVNAVLGIKRPAGPMEFVVMDKTEGNTPIVGTLQWRGSTGRAVAG